MSSALLSPPPAMREMRVSRPATVPEALRRKRELGSEARFWAGGTDLMLEWQRRLRSFSESIDLSRLIELRTISVTDQTIEIGACVTLDQLDRAAGQTPELGFLGSVARVMCTVQTRTLATVGGNLVNASPAADLAPPLMALDAVANLTSQRGSRTVAVAELFLGPKQAVVAPDELLTHIVVPRERRRHARYERVARTHVDIALAFSAVAIHVGDSRKVVKARVALGAAAPTPILVDVDRFIVGRRIDEIDESLARHTAAAVESAAAPIDDVRSTAAYRRRMCGVLTRRALLDAVREAGGQ